MKTHTYRILAAWAAAALLLAGAVAAAPPPAPGSDGKLKERVIKHIDARIRILETARACVRAARDSKAVLDCHTQERRQTKALREQDRGL